MEILERRREKRIRCVLEVGDINGQICANTFLTDISSIGAQLETPQSLEIGEPVEIGLSQAEAAPEEDGPYRLTGQVAWIRPTEPAPGRYRIGLSFFTPIIEATKILAKFRYRVV
jgi:hypothetical protein